MDSKLNLTATTVDWPILILGYMLLTSAARFSWLALRGWHALAKEDVPMADVTAVFLPWAAAAAFAGTWTFPAQLQQGLMLAAALWLLCLWGLSVRHGVGLRWRAMAIDAHGLSRLGVDTLVLARWLLITALVTLSLAILLLQQANSVGAFEHWALAGVALIMTGGRFTPVLTVIGLTVLLGLGLQMIAAGHATFLYAAMAMAFLLLLARRWRAAGNLLHAD